jgi:glycosyltransferase involved in cell wall biosynthesis
LVPPGDPKLLAKALAYVLDHPDEGARMAGAARAHLGDKFHPAVLGRDLAETYELALSGLAPTVGRRIGLVAHA